MKITIPALAQRAVGSLTCMLLPLTLGLLCAATATARSSTTTPGATAQPQLLPRNIVLDLATVQRFFPQVTYEAKSGRDTTAQGKPTTTRAVFFEDAGGSKRVTISVDSYANAAAARSAYATAVQKSKIPGSKSIQVPNLGDKTFAGTVTMGSEAPVGIGVLVGSLLVGATIAGFDASPANVTRIVDMTRAEVANAGKSRSGS